MTALARILIIPRAHAIGIMEMLWHWAGKYALPGDIGKWPDVEIAAAVEWSGKPEELINALLIAGWIDISESHRFIIHHWPEHCEDTIHNALAKSGRIFADGSFPKLTRLSREDREKATQVYDSYKKQSAEKRSNPVQKPPDSSQVDDSLGNQVRFKAPPARASSASAPCPLPEDYVKRETVHTTPNARAKKNGACIAPFNTSPDPLWEEIVGVSLAAGKKYSEPELRAACTEWVNLDDAGRVGACTDYSRKCRDGTWSDARHTPSLQNYFPTKAWEGVGPGRVLPISAPKSKGELAQDRANEEFMKGRKR